MLTRSERRFHARAAVSVTAIMFDTDAKLGRFVVQNLSAGGALLTGTQSVPEGRRVRVLLDLPGQRPVRVQAEVLRHAKAFRDVVVLAVAFRHASDRTQDLIQDALLAGLTKRARPAVLVVEDDPALRERLLRDLEALDRRVLWAATPLDAVHALEDPDEQLDTVIVDVALGHGDGAGLFMFLGEHYPELRRVVVQRDASRLQVPLARAVDARPLTLAEPWDVDLLGRALDSSS